MLARKLVQWLRPESTQEGAKGTGHTKFNMCLVSSALIVRRILYIYIYIYIYRERERERERV
jgi:hypothetical protein